MEFELFGFKKQQHHLDGGDGKILYEDRIKQLLLDLESESKKHINEINHLHDYYRPYVNQARDLEERIKSYIIDCESA